MARISNPIAAIEKLSSSGQGRQAELVTRSVGMKEAAAVIIAEEGQDAGWPHHSVEKGGYAGELIAIGVIRLQEDSMEQKHVERIDVIVGGLLEVTSVLAPLAVELAADDARAGLAPPVRIGKVREQDA